MIDRAYFVTGFLFMEIDLSEEFLLVSWPCPIENLLRNTMLG